MALTVLVAAYVVVGAAKRPELAGGLAGAGVAALAAGLRLRRAGAVLTGTFLEVVAYAVALTGGLRVVDAGAIAVAALLFLAAELALYSLELAAPLARDPADIRRILAFVASLSLAALGAAAIVGGAAVQGRDASLVSEAAGVAATLGAIGVVAALGRRVRET